MGEKNGKEAKAETDAGKPAKEKKGFQKKRKKTKFQLIPEIDLEFRKASPRLSRIPALNFFFQWMYHDGWYAPICLFVLMGVFLGFCLNHLGQFMSVDEEKWLYDRVPQLFDALKNGDWAKTYINDKPGVLPSLLAGLTNFKLDMLEYHTPEKMEVYLFWWRFPIVVFNTLMLPIIYTLSRKLFDSPENGLAITISMALFPILVGASQIVNPDATLWTMSTITFLAYLMYIKTGEKRYIAMTSLFFGLALISKFFVTIFYYAFFIILYTDYLFGQTDRQEFARKAKGLLVITVASIAVYTLLFPATWVSTSLIWQGTITNQMIWPVAIPFYVFAAAVLLDVLVFNGIVSNYARDRLKFDNLVYLFLATFYALTFFIVVIDILPGKDFIRQAPLNFFVNVLRSEQRSLTVLNIALLVGFVVFMAYALRFRKLNYRLFRFVLYAVIIIFFVKIGTAYSLGVLSVRYQIILYPCYAIVCGYVILELLRGYSWGKWAGISFIAISSVFGLMRTSPFYFHYNNVLNVRDITLIGNWGYGGYEMAQVFNQIEGSDNLSVWVDKEGSRQFCNGKVYPWFVSNPFRIKNLDYLILSRDGQNMIAHDKLKHLQGIPLEKYYKNAPAIASLRLGGNPNVFVKLVKFDASDFQSILGSKEPSLNGQKSHTIGFWVNFDSTGKQKLLELNGTGNFRLVTSDGDLFLVTAGGRHRIGRLPTKQWVHIFLEWKPESKETVVYANGQEYLKMRHASVTTSPQALKAYTFDGTIRDLRLYDYALSPAQRQAVLKNGANPNLKLKVGADTFTPVYYFAR